MSSAPSSPYASGLLGRAWASRRQDDFARLFAPDARAQELAALLWSNWIALGVDDVADESGGRLRVRWHVSGERGVALEDAVLQFAGGSVSGARPLGSAAPLWLVEPISHGATGMSDRTASVVGARGIPTNRFQDWATAAVEASRIVAGAGLGAAASSWDGLLVVELPSGPAAFAAVSGLGAAAASTAAVTLMASPESAPRIVGNLAATSTQGVPELRTLLVHEGVHAAVRSAVSTAPLWVSEGLAESIAAGSDPATRARNLALTTAARRPTALPSQADLGGADAPTAYALAALAVDAAIGRWGRATVMGWVADWTGAGRPSDSELAAAYLAALPR